MKKLKKPFKFEIGKCYRVRAFETQHLYRVKVEKIYDQNGNPCGQYRTFYGHGHYGPINNERGSFCYIVEAIEIPNL